METLRKRVFGKISRLLGQLATLLLAGGCSTFNHEWELAARQPAPANSLQGRWEGTWLSDVNHHTGALRCIVTQKEDGAWRARFHATYGNAFTFNYTVMLKVEPDTNGFKFNGEANLGWYAGGLYKYDGHADATNFFSTYGCKYDHGTFQMKRQ